MGKRAALGLLVCAFAAAGCGGGGDTERAATAKPSAEGDPRVAEINAATEADFPAVEGRTLQELANTVSPGPDTALASSVFTPGENRLAFGVLTDNKPVYGKTAVYVAPGPDRGAQGPFVARADSLITRPPFRSKQAATEADPFAAIYTAQVRLRRTGNASVLVVTKNGGQTLGAATQLKVVSKQRDSVPAVGDRAPAVDTDTVESAGNIEEIETRLPPDDMHSVNLKDVLGKKPVALIFATPQLCHSRVCGPVVDIGLQLKSEYGDRVEFIHQEVYVDNDLQKGLREPLKQFGLQTEPWLFTIDRSGRIAARLEGSFGVEEFELAVKAALE